MAIAWAGQAHALTTLRKVQVTDGSQIDLLFDGKISQKQIQTEFFNDIIQISLTDVSVYPAKIMAVQGMDLTKVFAYQYSPKLVRCRLTVNGKAEDYQGRFKVSMNGKVLSLKLDTPMKSDKVSTSSAAPSRSGTVPAESSAARANEAEPQIKGEAENALLKRVLKGESAKAEDGERQTSKKDGERARLTGGKPLPSPFKPIGILGAMLAVLAGGAFFLKKRKSGDSLRGHKAFAGVIGKFAKGLTPKSKLIEVLATHYLGPKKNIAVVKVGGRTLVLGVTDESINLITQIQGDRFDIESETRSQPQHAERPRSQASAKTASAAEPAHDPLEDLLLDELDFEPKLQQGATNRGQGDGATSAGPARFADLLDNEKPKPGVRARIRSRIEGLKQL